MKPKSVVEVVGRDDGCQVRSLALGLGLGFFVALQLGPMSLFLIRSTLRSGVATGLAVGLGIASIDAIYAALGMAGVAPFLALAPLRIAFGIAGAATLAVLGIRTGLAARQARAGSEQVSAAPTPGRAYLTSLAGTASNPSTIASWAGIFAVASTATGAAAIPLVLGVGVGSLGWVTMLACVVALLRRAASPKAIQVADLVAAAGLLGFAAVLGLRVVRST